MFECKLEQAVLFKKVVAAVLDIVKEGNFDLSDEGKQTSQAHPRIAPC